MGLGEFSVIERYFARRSVATPDLSLGIGDDAALIRVTPGHELAVSVDTLIAGRHFPTSTSAASIGHKCLAVNLSDMAAMGAWPRWFTLALSMPHADEQFLAPFSDSLLQLADQFGLRLIGGDTVAGPLALTLQILGEVPAGRALLRSGARPGDGIYVSGTLGDAAAGLAIVQHSLITTADASGWLVGRLDRPQPRVTLGMALRGVASAAIDISDGLQADLGHILERSGVGAELDLAALPTSPALLHSIADSDTRRRMQLGGGDDYELCFTVPPAQWGVLDAVATDSQVTLTRIGTITDRRGELTTTSIAGVNERLDPRAGFDHFRS